LEVTIEVKDFENRFLGTRHDHTFLEFVKMSPWFSTGVKEGTMLELETFKLMVVFDCIT
jgi:uncharacterized alpha-E superfamily protein